VFDFELFFDVLLIGNTIAFILSILPAIVNLKYYYDFRSTDNLLISIFFLAWGTAGFMRAIELNYAGSITFDAYYYSTFPSATAKLALFILAVRIKWTKPPPIIYLLGLFFILDYIMFLTPLESVLVNGYAFDTVYSGILNLFTYLFLIYTVLSSPIPLSINRIKANQFMWVLAASLLSLGSFTFLMRHVVLEHTISWSVVLSVLIPQYAASFMLFLLHFFFPEAVFISEEQVYRARRLYKKFVPTKIPSGKPILNIGSSAIIDYLNSIPEDIITEKPGPV
jgi:hypothetical protein